MLLGTIVNQTVLRGDPRFAGKPDYALNGDVLSSVALEQRAATDIDATKVVNALKDEFGSGTSALLRLFNASGTRLALIKQKCWDLGEFWKYPPDTFIENGQWSVLLAVRHGLTDCGGYLVYRPVEDGNVDIFIGWYVSRDGETHCYTEIREAGHWASDDVALRTHGIVKTAGKLVFDDRDKDLARGRTKKKFAVSLQIGNDTSPVVNAIFGRTIILQECD